MSNNPDLKKHQFKKGHKGMGGRPKGSQNISTILTKLLEQTLEIEDPFKKGDAKPKKKVRKKVGEIIGLRLIQNAMKGDIKAIREILDRTEGKSIQKTALVDPNAEENIPTVRIIGGLPPRQLRPDEPDPEAESENAGEE